MPFASRLKPPALQPGDTVGIVAPAAAVERPRLEAGCARLERMGYQPFYLESIFERDLYFAGTLGRRARELEEMFEREEVRAIVCARGGYGCNYLLGKIDLRKLAGRPKPLVGYSDVTTLLTWLSDTLNMVTFHGPMLAKDFASGSVHAASWLAALGGEVAWELAPLLPPAPWFLDTRKASSMAAASPCWRRRWARPTKSRPPAPCCSWKMLASSPTSSTAC